MLPNPNRFPQTTEWSHPYMATTVKGLRRPSANQFEYWTNTKVHHILPCAGHCFPKEFRWSFGSRREVRVVSVQQDPRRISTVSRKWTVDVVCMCEDQLSLCRQTWSGIRNVILIVVVGSKAPWQHQSTLVQKELRYTWTLLHLSDSLLFEGNSLIWIEIWRFPLRSKDWAWNVEVDFSCILIALEFTFFFKKMLHYSRYSWVELSWVELSWVELSWVELSWAELSWAELSWAELSWAELSWAELSWAELSWAELSWAELSWVELSWVELSWVELSWVNAS